MLRQQSAAHGDGQRLPATFTPYTADHWVSGRFSEPRPLTSLLLPFAGVDKIPNFEHIFVDFLTSTCTAEGSAVGGGSASSVAGLGATAPVVGEAGQVVQGSGTEQGGSAGQGQAPGLGDKKEQGAANARGHELGVGAETARGA